MCEETFGLPLPVHPGQTQAKSPEGIRRSPAFFFAERIGQRQGTLQDFGPIRPATLARQAEGQLDQSCGGGRPVSGLLRKCHRAKDELLRCDEIAALALEAGARNMSGPRACPEYSPTYYAAFFDDPSGNPLEICHTTT